MKEEWETKMQQSKQEKKVFYWLNPCMSSTMRVSMSCEDSTTTLSLAISNNLQCCDKVYFEFLASWTNVWESYHWLIWWGILALTAKVKPDANPYKQMPKGQNC